MMSKVGGQWHLSLEFNDIRSWRSITSEVRCERHLTSKFNYTKFGGHWYPRLQVTEIWGRRPMISEVGGQELNDIRDWRSMTSKERYQWHPKFEVYTNRGQGSMMCKVSGQWNLSLEFNDMRSLWHPRPCVWMTLTSQFNDIYIPRSMMSEVEAQWHLRSEVNVYLIWGLR